VFNEAIPRTGDVDALCLVLFMSSHAGVRAKTSVTAGPVARHRLAGSGDAASVLRQARATVS
jgi:hypothetical protein